MDITLPIPYAIQFAIKADPDTPVVAFWTIPDQCLGVGQAIAAVVVVVIVIGIVVCVCCCLCGSVFMCYTYGKKWTKARAARTKRPDDSTTTTLNPVVELGSSVP